MENLKNDLIDFRFGDCQEIILTIPDESVNIILTDPPYLYLKNQKLERVFDEKFLFAQFKRILKPGGFVVMFGRGTSFYRWNYILSELGFNLKEEIVWDKSHGSSPLMNLTRVHETISIHCKGEGSINKVKIPYLEMKGNDLPGVIQDLKRMSAILKNPKSLDAVKEYLETNIAGVCDTAGRSATVSSESINKPDRSVSVMQSLKDGMNEKSIIKDGNISDDFLTFMQTYYFEIIKICEDHGYDTILKEVRDHYTSIHPTQKPVSLLKRLLALVVKSPDDTVADFFAGSGATGEASIEMELPCILSEIDEEYFSGARHRLVRAYRNRNQQVSLF